MPNLTDVLNGEDKPTIEDIIGENTLSPITVDNKLVTEDDVLNLGGGDMVRSTYDSDLSGVVDDSEALGGVTPDGYVNTSNAQDISGIKTFTSSIKISTAVPRLDLNPSTGENAVVKFNDGLGAQVAYIGILNTDGVLEINNWIGTGINLKTTSNEEVTVNNNPIALTSVVNTFTAAQRGNRNQLSINVTTGYTAPDFSASNRFEAVLIRDIDVGTPTNLVANQGGVFYFTQDGVGGHSINWGSVYKFMNTDTSLKAANDIQVYSYEVFDATHIVMTYVGTM